jgi:KUP system potassium uptake protein
LQVDFVDLLFVSMPERVKITRLSPRFYEVHLRFGFMDQPDLTGTLHLCTSHEIRCDLMDTTFFLGRETLITRRRSDMPYWREKLFVALARNAGSPASYFGLPPNRVVELGTQVVL